MQSRKISPLEFIVFLVVIVIFVLVYVTCEKKFDLQKINGEQIININYYQDQTKKLQEQINNLQKKNNSLVIEKDNLSKKIETIIQENQNITKEKQIIISENKTITKEKQQLKNNLVSLVEKINSLLETASFRSQDGKSITEEKGKTPNFKFTLNTISTEDKFAQLSRGSYQRTKEIVNINVNDINAWKDLGVWKFTGYTATVEECDSSPSITANNSLVTPGFTLAIDPKYWPYGTIFYIDGYGFVISADSGSAIKGKSRGDILVADKKFSAYLTGQRNVWLVYSPPSTSPKK